MKAALTPVPDSEEPRERCLLKAGDGNSDGRTPQCLTETLAHACQ